MNLNRTLLSTILAGAMIASTTVGASAQTITHWVDRQIHGTARHATPRHHKPGEPPYPGEQGYDDYYGRSYTYRPERIVTYRTTTTTYHRHHWRRHRHHDDGYTYRPDY